MKKDVLLSICGKQKYQDQEPECIELVTAGVLESTEEGWFLTYEETDLTGLEGVTTTFHVEPGTITLSRKGQLDSQMVFRKDVPHESLYQMPFGALMITVCAREVRYEIGEAGGTIDLAYDIEIEQNAAGKIEYHLDIRVKE
jgi:uncharacterized beta-barrel protein YwiB (DUF1934 family)